jgi:hypothetical protein
MEGTLGLGALRIFSQATGIFEPVAAAEDATVIQLASTGSAVIKYMHGKLVASRVVPTGAAVAPRRFGSLACVYLGKPAS